MKKSDDIQSLSPQSQCQDQVSKFESLQIRQYLAQITPIAKKSQQSQRIFEQLRQNGFEYDIQHSFSFKKKIVQCSQDSARYEVQYGHFKTYINILTVEYNLSAIKRQIIGKGRSGCALLFKYDQQPIVAKQILFEVKSNILIEIFWAKIASILKIGPEFKNYYGYDIISLSRYKAEYLMEQCNNVYYPIEAQQLSRQQFPQKLKNRLNNILQVLHFLSAIHGDIKPQHIVWSPKYNNLVLIDFGMALFVSQNLGNSTKTQYFGTYTYSSPNMRKALLLKQSYFVDLYYNDLYGLNIARQKIIESLSFWKISKEQMKIENSQWGSILNFFKFKFYIFNQNLKNIQILTTRQQYLRKCFLFAIRQYTSNEFQEISKLRQHLQNLSKKYEKVDNKDITKEANEILCMELLSFQNRPRINKIEMNQDQLELMYQNKTFCDFIKNIGNEKIFEYLFIAKNSNEQQIQHKKLLIKYIFLSHVSPQIQSEIKMNRSVVLIFQNYFYQTGNFVNLKYIQNIFRLACEFSFLKEIQKNICEVFLKNPETWIEYFIKGLYCLFLRRQSPRKSWQWLITNLQLRQKTVKQKNSELINNCLNLINAVDKKITYDYIKISCSMPQQLEISNFNSYLNEGKTLESQQSLFVDNIFIYKIIDVIEQNLRFGVLNCYQEIQYTTLLTLLTPLKYILRETIWKIIYYYKNSEISRFQKCLQLLFDDVFISNMCEGIGIFPYFILFFNFVKNSSTLNNKLIKFVTSISVKNILASIKDNYYSLKQLLKDFFEVSEFFYALKVNQIEKKSIRAHLLKQKKQILNFFEEQSHKWLLIESIDIRGAIEVIKVYYYIQNNEQDLQKTASLIKQFKMIAKQEYDQQIIGSIVIIINNNIEKLILQGRIYELWLVIKSLSEQKMFNLLGFRSQVFKAIIIELCSQNLFEQCFSVLQKYGQYKKFLNNNHQNLYNYAVFINKLPQNVAKQLFVDRISEYNFKRIKQSPLLSLLLQFFFGLYSSLVQNSHKIRYIKLIAFGMSKITIRYRYYNYFNGQFLTQSRLFIKWQNSRKINILLRRQARKFHYDHLSQAIKDFKKNKFYKIKIRTKNADSLNLFFKKKQSIIFKNLKKQYKEQLQN